MMWAQGSEWIKNRTSDISLTNVEPNEWIEFMEKANYVLPFTLVQQNWQKSEQGEAAPTKILLPGGWNFYNPYPSGAPISQSFKDRFDTVITDWQSKLLGGSGFFSPEYMVVRNSSREELSRSSEWFGGLVWFDAPQIPIEDDLFEQYAFYAVIRFDDNGAVTIPTWYGLPDSWRDRLMVSQMNHSLVASEFRGGEAATDNFSQVIPYLDRIKGPSGFTIAYALPRSVYSGEPTLEHYRSFAMESAGFRQLCLIALGCALLIGLLPLEMLRRKASEGAEIEGKNKSDRSFHIRWVPLEFWVTGAGLSVFYYIDFAKWSYEAGRAWHQGESTMPIGLSFAVWLLVLIVWCGLGWFLMTAIRQGFVRTLIRRSLFGRFGAWLHAFDLSDRSDRSLLKVMTVHFGVLIAVMVLTTHIQYYALILLIPYLLAVFYRIKTDKDRFRRSYDRLFASVQGMARGDLNIRIDDDLRFFNPMKNELQRVREGFKHAVEKETKSQKMKSELVTNVSHDLKTPLTAIVTYINLLQQANLTEEERRSYIDVLSGKSQRLNRLIEDLFEYTRASSGSTDLSPVSVDLVELLKQAQVELDPLLAESGLQLRLLLPEHKVILPLDSEKTFRIFENLYLNMAKYSMPGSRAYVELTDKPTEVGIAFKNVSAAELDFRPDEITERFVRGDRARNTEGSGLGLAIVKSLVELQGGAFRIELDGDLFKAVIIWPKTTAHAENNPPHAAS